MSGRRLGSFRSGDRSEYLATYALSRVAFVNPIPRQEDFGIIDTLCVLGREEAPYVFPESAFYVQIKSRIEKLTIDGHALRWLTQYMDHPLFICIVDKETQEISLYSCSQIWRASFLLRDELKSVDVSFNGAPEVNNKANDNITCEVNLGMPIFRQTLAEIESDSSVAYSVLKDWIQIDAANIAHRRIGKIATTTFSKWNTNIAPLSDPTVTLDTTYFFGHNFELAEKDLSPILTALAHNYRNAKQRDKLQALSGFLATIQERLDEHGRKFATGELTID